MIAVEELLKPISPEKPCGEDASIFQLENALRGKEATQFREAEDPNWKELRELSLASFKQSKHLTTSVILTLALMKTEDLAGLRDGLALVRGLVERHWEPLYPRLDPEDNNDPTERINILNNLASYEDPFRFIPRLQEVPLGFSAKLGPATAIKLKDILAAKAKAQAPAGTETTGPSEAQLTAVLRDAKVDLLKANFEAATSALQEIQHLETFLTTTVGAGYVPNLEELVKTLRAIQTAIAPYVGAVVETGAAADAASAPAQASAAAAGRNGKIASREDVLRVLDEVCEYYTRFEPASPIPFIIKRAQRMVKMNFIEIINELTPDSITQVKVITGPDPAETPPT